MFNLSFLASNLALVGEKNLEKASAVEQGTFSLLVIVQPALAAFLWNFYGIKLLSLFAFLLTLLPFSLILSMNFSRFVQPKKSTVSATNSFSNSFKLLFHQTVITNVFWLMLIFSFFIAGY